MTEEKDLYQRKRLTFYQVILEARVSEGLNLTRLLITISVSLIALLPQFYKDIHSELVSVALIGLGIVVISGLLMNRLDYKQLESLQKQNEGKKAKDYTGITSKLLVVMLFSFIFSLLVMIYVACNYNNYKEKDMPKDITVKIELQRGEEKPTFDDLTGIITPNKENPNIKKRK